MREKRLYEDSRSPSGRIAGQETRYRRIIHWFFGKICQGKSSRIFIGTPQRIQDVILSKQSASKDPLLRPKDECDRGTDQLSRSFGMMTVGLSLLSHPVSTLRSLHAAFRTRNRPLSGKVKSEECRVVATVTVVTAPTVWYDTDNKRKGRDVHAREERNRQKRSSQD